MLGCGLLQAAAKGLKNVEKKTVFEYLRNAPHTTITSWFTGSVAF